MSQDTVAEMEITLVRTDAELVADILQEQLDGGGNGPTPLSAKVERIIEHLRGES